MNKKRKDSISIGNWFKVSLLLVLFAIAINLNYTINSNSHATSGSYSQSSVFGDFNLTVTVNSLNLQWDETLELNITAINTTSLELIPNSIISLNISSLIEIFIIVPMTETYYLARETINASSGYANRSIPIRHIPTLNNYTLTVEYLNESISILNVSFDFSITSTRTGFISFFTFEHFIILYFGLLCGCGIYLFYSKYRNKDGAPTIER